MDNRPDFMGVFDHPQHQYVASLSTQPTTEHIRSQLNADVLNIHSYLSRLCHLLLTLTISYNIEIHTSVCCSIGKNVLILKHIHAHIIAFCIRRAVAMSDGLVAKVVQFVLILTDMYVN